jgi:hypothetical protein
MVASTGSRVIDWFRIAEPQFNQYDTEIALDFAQRSGYVRRTFPTAPHIMDGAIAVVDEGHYRLPSCCVPAPADHENIRRACELLEFWPEVACQFRQLTETVAFYQYRGAQRQTYHSTGTERFGGIAATVDHAVELAECLVHEMAHHKLRALGVHMNDADRIFLNPADECFHSPIRYDCLRPMPAVFQAQSSFTYAAALHCRIATATQATGAERSFALLQLANLLPKLEFGEAVIREHALLDSAGRDFLAGYQNWFARVRETAYALLAQAQMPVAPFTHPLSELDAIVVERSGQAGVSKSTTSADLPAAEAIPHARPGVQAYQVIGEMVLYSPAHERAYSLNDSARAIWELCDGQRSAWVIAEALGARIAFPAEDLLPDVRTALLQLGTLGLLELQSTQGEPSLSSA